MLTWAEWTLRLHRPPRTDDEEVPDDLALVPWWHALDDIAGAFGVPREHVERREPYPWAVTAGDFGWPREQRYGPAPSDTCWHHCRCRHRGDTQA